MREALALTRVPGSKGVVSWATSAAARATGPAARATGSAEQGTAKPGFRLEAARSDTTAQRILFDFMTTTLSF
jgi:hypothetical protein